MEISIRIIYDKSDFSLFADSLFTSLGRELISDSPVKKYHWVPPSARISTKLGHCFFILLCLSVSSLSSHMHILCVGNQACVPHSIQGAATAFPLYSFRTVMTSWFSLSFASVFSLQWMMISCCLTLCPSTAHLFL